MELKQLFMSTSLLIINKEEFRIGWYGIGSGVLETRWREWGTVSLIPLENNYVLRPSTCH
jgi:hypothetical protein